MQTVRKQSSRSYLECLQGFGLEFGGRGNFEWLIKTFEGTVIGVSRLLVVVTDSSHDCSLPRVELTMPNE